MGTLVPGASLAASALGTSSSFIGYFAPVLAVVAGVALLGAFLMVLSHIWKG